MNSTHDITPEKLVQDLVSGLNRKKQEAIAKEIANCVGHLTRIDSSLDFNLRMIAKECCPFYIGEATPKTRFETSPIKSILASVSAKNYLTGLGLDRTIVPHESVLDNYNVYMILQESGNIVSESTLVSIEKDIESCNSPTLGDFVEKRDNVTPSLLALFETCVGLGKEYNEAYLEFEKLSQELALATCPFSIGEPVKISVPDRKTPIKAVVTAICGSIFETYRYTKLMGGSGINLNQKGYSLEFEGIGRFQRHTEGYSAEKMTAFEEFNGKTVSPNLNKLFRKD